MGSKIPFQTKPLFDPLETQWVELEVEAVVPSHPSLLPKPVSQPCSHAHPGTGCVTCPPGCPHPTAMPPKSRGRMHPKAPPLPALCTGGSRGQCHTLSSVTGNTTLRSYAHPDSRTTQIKMSILGSQQRWAVKLIVACTVQFNNPHYGQFLLFRQCLSCLQSRNTPPKPLLRS